MSKLGTKDRPAIIRVRTEERAQQLTAYANARGIQVICGIEPDKPEDITDLKKAERPQHKSIKVSSPSRNAPCPCGSGRKYKGCCGKQTR